MQRPLATNGGHFIAMDGSVPRGLAMAFDEPRVIATTVIRPVADVRTDGHGCKMSRSEFVKTAMPQLIAKVCMYETAAGGRTGPAYSGWGCPCMVSKMEPLIGYDALPLIGDEPLLPGEMRQLGFFFLSHEEAVPIMRAAGQFFLWEGRFVGEAIVLS